MPNLPLHLSLHSMWRKRHGLASAAGVVLLAGCAAVPSPNTAAVAAPADTPWVGEARGVAAAVPPRLLAVLSEELTRGGPEAAIGACREQAPALARKASDDSGWQVRRVSLKPRNPKAVPDAWERAALEDFDRLAAAGAPPATLERSAVVTGADGRREQRYLKALPVAELCTGCHGTPEKLSPAVVARLAALYPADRGVGYRVGDIRGAITLRRAAPSL